MFESVLNHPEILKEVMNSIKLGIANGKNYSVLSSELQTKFPSMPLSRHTISRLHVRSLTNKQILPIPVKSSEEVVAISENSQILALKDKLLSANRILRNSMREDIAIDQVLQDIKGTIKALPKVNSNLSTSKSETNSDSVKVGLVSCLHFGEVVSYEETMRLAQYNPTLAAARLEKYVTTLTQNKYCGGTLYLACVGDNISGNIHEELKITNAFPFGEQIVRCAYLWALAIRDLAACYDKVNFIGVVGNHARFEMKPPYKEKYNNGDYLIYRMVQALLANQNNVEFTIPYSPWHIENIKGHNFYFAHGDQLRSSGGFPWAATQKYVTNMTQVLTRNNIATPKYWCFGNFHQFNSFELNYGEWLFTASFKGGDDFSLGSIPASDSAMELLFEVNEKEGITWRYPINLDEADPIVYNRYLVAADPNWNPTPSIL